MNSTIFDYSKGVKDTLNFDGFLPGQETKGHPNFLAMSAIVKNGKTVEAGMAVKITRATAGNLVVEPIEADDTADKFAGIIERDEQSQKDYTLFGGPQFIYAFPAGMNVSLVRNGYVAVPVQNATPTISLNGTLYMRIKTGAGKVVGGIESAADTTNTVALTKCHFTGLSGYPTGSTNDGTTSTQITGRTAEILLELGAI